eukprot:c4147_g1_i1.p1 GENE.c4147_g1_i1~~c4147_g1_i1.p1  ORF type:complete len:327 (-),score=85.11 c4147_g1_i1:69-1019(-)
MEVGAAQIEELKTSIKSQVDAQRLESPAVTEWLDDYCYGTYIRAHGTNAAKKLIDTINWRIDFTPRSIPCPLCLKNPYAHSLRLIGFDALDRAVVFSDMVHAHNRWDVSANIRHLCSSIEHCFAVGQKFGWSEKMVWVVDFYGFGLRDCDPRSMSMANTVIAHYPDRLGHIYLLDAPGMFSASWKLVRPLLDPITASKISFISMGTASDVWRGRISTKADTGVESKLDLGEEVANWLLREVAESRVPALHNKKYWETRGDVATGGHDPRGVASYVTSPHFLLEHAHMHYDNNLLPDSEGENADGNGNGNGSGEEVD